MVEVFLMKKCILCKKSLYQNISFHNMFQEDYQIHKKCEELLNRCNTISFPFMSILVHIHILFPSQNENPDKFQLFTRYGEAFFIKHNEQKEDSLFILIDDKITDIEFLLTAKLCTKSLILWTYTNEAFLLLNEEKL